MVSVVTRGEPDGIAGYIGCTTGEFGKKKGRAQQAGVCMCLQCSKVLLGESYLV